MAKKKKAQTATALNAMASDLVDVLNKQFNSHTDKAASFLGASGANSEVTSWVSTGNDLLDIAISNKKNGGYPVGRIIEVTGLEASGKSLLAAYALKSTQENGGIAVYIDTEAATSREYLSAIGVDIDKLIYLQLEALEDIFEAIERTITQIREHSKDTLLTIIVDSIMGSTTKKELSGEWGKDGYATEKAIVLSKAMRKLPTRISKENVCLIFTNQLRQRLGVTFGDQWCVDPFTTKIKIRYPENYRL